MTIDKEIKKMIKQGANNIVIAEVLKGEQYKKCPDCETYNMYDEKQDCQQDEVKCYFCAGEESRDTTIDGTSCPENEGYFEEPQDCEGASDQVSCYFCAGKELRNTLVDGTTCNEEEGHFETEISCETGQTCYYCSENTQQTITITLPDTCESEGFSPVEIDGCGVPCVGEQCDCEADGTCPPCVGEDCEPNWFDELSTTSKIIYGVGILIILSSLIMILGGKKK